MSFAFSGETIWAGSLPPISRHGCSFACSPIGSKPRASGISIGRPCGVCASRRTKRSSRGTPTPRWKPSLDISISPTLAAFAPAKPDRSPPPETKGSNSTSPSDLAWRPSSDGRPKARQTAYARIRDPTPARSRDKPMLHAYLLLTVTPAPSPAEIIAAALFSLELVDEIDGGEEAAARSGADAASRDREGRVLRVPLEAEAASSAGCPTFEVRITYPFQPRSGEIVTAVGSRRHAGADHFIIRQTGSDAGAAAGLFSAGRPTRRLPRTYQLHLAKQHIGPATINQACNCLRMSTVSPHRV